ncbi:hypothetical protein HPC49_34135 [Pyxidicoccus fallax]|uniref:MxcI protein n=1 Tax=Pyxidicoccus fallax TaxID=394095 RepID=A0A848LS88_9BACT|nr:hypothetical protein [Pyxidicoccus fallax]NMO20490.1 hypothetical protein [Pyxidicoccus fallax]NPC83248.1 hypothetical protein [Pyxidicoccus fallax]
MKPSSFRLSRLTAAALALSLFAACGDDEKEPTPQPQPPPETPMYAAVAQTSVNGASTSYVVLTDKVDLTTPLTLENAIEISGRALGSGIAKTGSLYVSSSEGADITRYDLTSEGRLERKTSVSFSGRGVNNISEYQNQFQFVSPTKAYYFDGRTSQVIVWNPTEMTVTSAVPVAGLAVEGGTTTFATHPVRSGNLVIMPVGWRTSNTAAVIKRAGVIVVDTTTDSATLVEDPDARCGYVRDGVVGPDGMVYLGTEAYGAAAYRVAGGSTPVPCLLKFNPQTREFDRQFFRELSSFTGGGTTGALLPGPQGTAYLRVLNANYAIGPNTSARTVASAAEWGWWQLKLDTLVATKVDTLPASTGSTFLFNAADNRVLFTEFANNSSTTNFRELTDHSGKVAFSTQGLAFSFLQLR